MKLKKPSSITSTAQGVYPLPMQNTLPTTLFVLSQISFQRFGVKKEEVAQLILLCPELLKVDLEKQVINVLELLKHYGMSSKDLEDISFGENALTMNLLDRLHGTSSELQERFDCLLRSRIEFSKLCVMVRKTPRILNQNYEIIGNNFGLCGNFSSNVALSLGGSSYTQVREGNLKFGEP
ncbi:hypothetical protein L195_g032940 [Trifolium pratense]|uniref:Uncharacterized protein n=1 Tax=Trifolium pratense TaxID=57577 RepID=A0A2K3LEN5_TRIPR|nr:hypothetical protein L195_g032940 [Trifolium pratense]